MPIFQEKTGLFEALFQPREDYFALENIQSLLPRVITYVADIGCAAWDKEALRELSDDLNSGRMLLTSSATQGIKGLHGSHPMHGALLKIAECNAEEVEKRLYLLAHIINVAYQWREEIQHIHPDNSLLPSEKKRLKYTTYINNLEAACKVSRKIDIEWLDAISEWHGSSAYLQKKLQHTSADLNIFNYIYIQQLERFFAYGLNSRQPRKGHSKKASFSNKKATTVKRQKPMDDASDAAIDAPKSSRITVRQPSENDDDIRQSGLSLNEETAPIELLQSDQPIARKRGDSSLQAVYRARSQRQHQDKSAQLLPGRWEQLSRQDLYYLDYRLRDQQSGAYKKLACLIGLMLATGRDLDSVLDTHVVKDMRQVPKKIDDQAVYVTRTGCEWFSGIFRPESGRRISNQWRDAMRPTLMRLTLPIHEVSQSLITPHAWLAGMHVRKRSVPLFKEAEKKRVSDELKQLLSAVNRETGARLTEKRLISHLFNMLNVGEADLAAACLITARMPTFGQQSPLYYYAPSVANLAQQYAAAMQRIGQQLSITYGTDTSSKNIQPANQPVPNSGYVGSQMVPYTRYVTELVTQMLQQRQETRQRSSLFHQYTAFHNAYTAYTIAMLMFCTGYRSIRDPLPNQTHISLPRAVIVIADKTNDHQSNARFLPLPEIMVEQFGVYLQHRKAMLNRLQLFLGHDWETPFLFLDEHGNPQQVTPSRLKTYLQWPQSPPLNINRHYLHTQLKERGCSAEIVDAFMGHWDSGQEPWAKYSTFCPREYRAHITLRIEEVMQEQGWKVIKGIAL